MEIRSLHTYAWLALVLMACAAAPAWAASRFKTDLDPVAFDASTRADVAGEGHVLAVLDGATISLSGRYAGLSAPATAAHLMMGLAKGVPGPAIAEVSFAGGALSAKLTLDPSALAALKAGGLYLQIDNAKAGALWGWLEPASNGPRGRR